MLDVDDTLLARNAAGRKDEVFGENTAINLLPRLLEAGFRVGLITGHGWKQLKTRLADPLLDFLRERSIDLTVLKNLFVYTNQGATKIQWSGRGWSLDSKYNALYAISATHLNSLKNLLIFHASQFNADYQASKDYYKQNFPTFDFNKLPATVQNRESAVLNVRPLPSEHHKSKDGKMDVPRNVVKVRVEGEIEKLGLAEIYKICQSGLSSLDLVDRKVSKTIAVRSILSELGVRASKEIREIEKAVIYIGDEFTPSGNDYCVAVNFPFIKCFSVASAQSSTKNELQNVIQFAELKGTSGTRATSEILEFFLDSVPHKPEHIH
ncbi:MAG TPA: hypothetical protein VK308_12375 [Pyrinomonadaceae bacterium]|nr:hypothetical protein [Pyrinomonadaceae bacterium]